jgi:hypothetical protein
MAERYTFCVMLQVTTSDARLSEQAVAESLGTGKASAFAKLRHAVLQHVPRDVSRVIALMPVEHAKLLMQLHEAFGDEIVAHLKAAGIKADEDGTILRPPADYVPPTSG